MGPPPPKHPVFSHFDTQGGGAGPPPRMIRHILEHFLHYSLLQIHLLFIFFCWLKSFFLATLFYCPQGQWLYLLGTSAVQIKPLGPPPCFSLGNSCRSQNFFSRGVVLGFLLRNRVRIQGQGQGESPGKSGSSAQFRRNVQTEFFYPISA